MLAWVEVCTAVGLETEDCMEGGQRRSCLQWGMEVWGVKVGS